MSHVTTAIDPASAAFLLAESRQQPMHVGALQLYAPPAHAGRDYVRQVYEQMREVEELAPLFLKHPTRSLRAAGQLVWQEDLLFDIDHHVRHSALPRPGRIRELLELCSRLHSQRLARERPLWESHVIEGLSDGRVAMYTKIHHSLLDGVSAMRLLHGVLSTDAERRDMPAPWAARRDALAGPRRPGEGSAARAAAEHALAELPASVVRSALGVTAEAAGMPAALVRTLGRSLRNETSSVSLHAPRTIFNQPITGSRRVAAQDWPMERMRLVARAADTTLNDVVLAMCSGAVRTYLAELGELPDASLVAMVPVALEAQQSQLSPDGGGNAVGCVMVRLGTQIADPASRLRSIHESMCSGKEALASMTPAQVLAMSAIGLAPSVLTPLLRAQGIVRPPFNLIISNVPGPRKPLHWNGMRLVGNYPLSIPINGMALNITCTSYAGSMAFGLVGCRRTVPHLQRLLTHLDEELSRLERATAAA